MKLICINNKTIKIAGFDCYGHGLVVDNIYYGTIGEEIGGKPCYYIDGLGLKLACRFKEVDDFADAILERIKKEMELETCLN